MRSISSIENQQGSKSEFCPSNNIIEEDEFMAQRNFCGA
jgi:hypothetical protein